MDPEISIAAHDGPRLRELRPDRRQIHRIQFRDKPIRHQTIPQLHSTVRQT